MQIAFMILGLNTQNHLSTGLFKQGMIKQDKYRAVTLNSFDNQNSINNGINNIARNQSLLSQY